MYNWNLHCSRGYGLPANYPSYAFDSSDELVPLPAKRKRAPPPPRPDMRQRFPKERHELETKRRRGEEYFDDMRRLQHGPQGRMEDVAPHNPRHILHQRPEQTIQHQLLQGTAIGYVHPEAAIQAQLLYGPYDFEEEEEEEEEETPLHSPPPFKKRKLNSGFTSNINIPNNFLGTPSAQLGIIPATTIHGLHVLRRVSGVIIPAVAKCCVEVVRNFPGAVSRFVGDVKNNAGGRGGEGSEREDDEQEDEDGVSGNDHDTWNSESDSGDSDGSDDDDTPRANVSVVPLPAPRPTSDILPDYLVPRRLPRTQTARGDTKKGRGGQNVARPVGSASTVPMRRTAAVQTDSVPKILHGTPARTKTVVNGKLKRPAQPDSCVAVESPSKKRKTTSLPSSPPPPLSQPRIKVQGMGFNAASPISRIFTRKPDKHRHNKDAAGKRMVTTTSQPSKPTPPTQTSTQSTQTCIICPNCATRHLTETTSCENCGTPWPPKPAPKSQARYIVRDIRKPDVIHFPATDYCKARDFTLVTYARQECKVRKPGEKSDDEGFTMTGGAGPAGTLDVDGTPFDIPEEERTRLLEDARVQKEEGAHREANERRRKNRARSNGLDYPGSQPYYDECGPPMSAEEVTKQTPKVDRGTKKSQKPKTDKDKMEKTKNIIKRIWKEQCIAGIAQQYLNLVAELQREAIAQGRAFPEGITGWDEMNEAEQQRVRRATRAIEENERRSSSATGQATTHAANDSQVEETQEQQQVLKIDEALVARFENGSNASIVQQLAEERTHMVVTGHCWPDDIIGWADDYSDEERNFVLEATRYLEQKEAIENSMPQHSPGLSDTSSSEDEN
ncbi:hypothetical protein PTT_12906 [Pyrenophora teres f. teres 0-1]|uniref:Uncharacterized protein n=1 Tax=Pyrenophora teres f. teres (strain 0-1) TaxID=861557 RepID=E3RUW3_PYRTT|nr:hypothetical protein PTT_12906 [Pyrenophora teres f. teres 0-1]